MKQTLIHDERTGSVGFSDKRGQVYNPNDIAKQTMKQTLIHDERTGSVGFSDKRGQVYDPNDIAKATIKETNIDNNRKGQIQTISSNGHANLPLPPKITARDTLKQYIEYSNLKGPKANQKYNKQSLKTTIKETIREDNHLGIPTDSRGKGYITNPKCAPPTNKQFTSNIEYSGQAQGTQKGSYSVTNVNAPNTTRQTTSDHFYSGSAEGVVKPISYEDIYNATINEIKEELIEGRTPTLSGPKSVSELSKIGNVEVKSGLENRTIVTETPLQNTPIDPSTINMNTENCTSEIQNERIDPKNLTPFAQNPYTQSLNSAA